MSKTVDQKVVQMQFDNAGFEQNAKQTMSTLDKLKAALKFDGANKGAEELNKSIKGIDFSQAEIAATRAGFHIQDVWLKISNVLEYQIARKIINVGENIARSLTFDQITAGFGEYQLKMDSINTIIASTGEELATVNGYLEELNHYSDKTIYSFSDMTQNIGKFTNAGVKLNDAVAAIQGVANVAAVSGANANEASRAMYNFAQALSAGYVKLIDWKSIENANMATVEFKDTLLQTAVAMGTAEAKGDGMYKILTKNAQGKTMEGLVSSTKNFNDSLQQQWMTTNVLTQALEIYSKDVRDMTDEEIYNYEQRLKAAGFTDKQILQFEELGIKATDAATKVRTFGQLFDAIKESIGSGWAMAFENVIGNLDEARDLLTKIKDSVDVIVSGSFNRLNTLLSNWKERGGRNSLIASFENIAAAISKVISVAKQLWYDLFPPTTSKNLYQATKSFEIFTRSLIMNEDTANNLRETLHYLLTPVKVLIELVKFGFKLIVPLVGVLQPLLKISLSLTSALAKTVVIIAKAVYQSQTFQKLLNAIKTTITTVWNSIKSFATTIGTNLVNAFQNSNSWLRKLIDSLVFLGKLSLGAIVTALNTIANFRFSDVTAGIDKMKAKLKEFIDGLRESAKESKVIQVLVEVIDKLKSAFEFLKEAFLAFSTSFSEGLEHVKSFSDLLTLIKDSAENAFKPVINFFKEKIFGETGNVFDNLKTSFMSFIDALKEGAKNIPWTKVLLVAFCLGLAAAVLQLVNAISKFSMLASALSESIRIVNETVKTFTGIRNRLRELKEISTFIAVITLAIAGLSMIPKDDLIRAAVTLSAVAGGLMVLAEVMMLINKKAVFKPGAMSQLFVSLAGLAAGAAILTAAIYALSDLKKTISELLPYIGELGVVMLELIASMTLLSIIGKKLQLSMSAFSALSLIAFAGSVYFLCEALKDLATVDFKDVEDLTKVLISVLGGFAVITALTKKLGFWSFASLIAIMIGLKNLVPTIEELATLNISEDTMKILDMVTKIIAIVGAVSALTSILSTIVKILRPKKAILGQAHSLLGDFSRTLLAIGISTTIMVLAITNLINTIDKLQNPNRIVGSLIAAGVIIAALGVFIVKVSQGGKIFTTHKGSMLKFGAGVALLSASIVPLVFCVEEIAKFGDKYTEAPILKAGVIVGALVVALGTFAALSSKAAGVDFKLILSIFGGITAVVGEIIIMSLLIEEHEEQVLDACGALGIILIGLDGAIFWLSKMNFGAVKMGPIVAFTAALAALFGGMLLAAGLLDDKDIDRLGDICLAFIVSCITIAGSIAILSKASLAISWAPILAFTALLATFAASFIAVAKNLENIDWVHMEEVFNGFIGIIVLLGGVSFALAKISAGWEIAVILLSMAGAIVALAGAVKMLEDLDASKVSGILDNLVKSITELALLAGTLAVVGTAFKEFNGVLIIATAVIDSIAISIGIMSAGIGIMAAGIGYLSEQLDAHLVPALIKLGENADTVKTGIQALADAISYAIETIAASVANGIVVIAKSISIGVSGIITSTATSISAGILIIGSTLTTGIDLVWNQVKTKITEKFPFLKQHGTEAGTNFKDGLSSSQSLLIVAAQGILTTLISTLGSGMGSFFNIGASLVGALIDGFRSKGSGGKYIETEVENAVYGANATASKTIQTLYKKNQTATGIAASERQKYLDGWDKGLHNKFLPALKDVNGKAADNTKSASDKVNSLWKGTLSDTISNFEIFGHRVGDVTKEAGGFFKDLGTNITDWLDPTKWAGDALNFEDTIKQIEEAAKGAGEAATGAGAGFEDLGKSASKGAKGVKEAKDEISSFVEKMESSFNILDEFDLGLDEENPLTGDKLLQNMQSNITGMTTWANEMVSIAGKVPEGLYKKLADMGPQGYKYVHAFAQMTEEQLMQVQTLYAQSLIIPTAVTQQIYGGMFQAATNAHTGFINGLNIPAMQESGKDMAVMFLAGLTGPTGLDSHSPSRKTMEQGVNAGMGFKEGLSSAGVMGVIKMAAEDICRLVLDTFKENLSAREFVSIGKSISDGLTEGIEQNEGKVGSAIARLCAKVKEVATSRNRGLDINSPSKVFIEIGKFVDEGLAKGIADNIGMVDDSVSKMADQTVNNMRGAIETIQTIADSDLNVEPVIRPVVDLSNVQNGANSINSLMGMNFGTNVTMPAASFMTQSELINNSDNTAVVAAVNSLKDDVVSLKDAITNMKIMLDSGTMVGAMTPMIDQELGMRQVYAGRGI